MEIFPVPYDAHQVFIDMDIFAPAVIFEYRHIYPYVAVTNALCILVFLSFTALGQFHLHVIRFQIRRKLLHSLAASSMPLWAYEAFSYRTYGRIPPLPSLLRQRHFYHRRYKFRVGICRQFRCFCPMRYWVLSLSAFFRVFFNAASASRALSSICTGSPPITATPDEGFFVVHRFRHGRLSHGLSQP